MSYEVSTKPWVGKIEANNLILLTLVFGTQEDHPYIWLHKNKQNNKVVLVRLLWKETKMIS